MPRRHAREPYQEFRSRLQARWRPLILKRDRNRCRVCMSRDDPEMAHVTDCVAFSRAAGGRKEGVTFSFRWDNLVTLCAACHAASHAMRPRGEDLERRMRVERLMERVRRLRGWSTPFAVLPPGQVPAGMAVERSFHDVIRLTPMIPFPTFARYAADGGLVLEAPRAARQRRLPDVVSPAGAPDASPFYA